MPLFFDANPLPLPTDECAAWVDGQAHPGVYVAFLEDDRELHI
jgi:hypothetical protein